MSVYYYHLLQSVLGDSREESHPKGSEKRMEGRRKRGTGREKERMGKKRRRMEGRKGIGEKGGGRNITIFISLIQFWKLICKILSVIIIALKCVRLSSQNPRPIVFCG